MGSITTIVVPDAQATPVNHTFNPVKTDGDTAYLVEQSSTSSIGYWPLVLTQRAPLSGQTERVYRTKLSLGMPVTTTETINGVSRPKLEYTLRANVEFVIPESATLQNRKDIRKIVEKILADASFVSMVESQQNLY